jgi:PAS domain-containing protein
MSVIVAVGTGIFLSNLRDRELVSNEETLSNTAFIVAEQIEHIFTTVATVQKEIIQQTADFANLGEDGFERELSRYDFHVKLRDKVSGMPYVGALTVFNAQGRLINFSRQWPIPDNDASDRDFVKAFQSDPNLSSFIGKPIHNLATGTWVVHLARKISGLNGEFWGLTTAAIELQYLENVFNRIAAKPDSGISLLRDDGTLFVRIPKIESNIGRRFPSAIGIKLVSAADHGVSVSVGVIGGGVRAIAAHRVGSYPVVVAATKTAAMVFADWKRVAKYTIFAAALAIITIAAFAILFIKMFSKQHALVKARAERDHAETIRDQSLRLDAALNNMSQGLTMFDSSERIILCNQGYMDMYALSPDAVTPGLTLHELLHYRQAQGSFAGDIEEYRLELLNGLAQGETRSAVAISAAGHSHRVINVPMAGGTTATIAAEEAKRLRLVPERQRGSWFPARGGRGRAPSRSVSVR